MGINWQLYSIYRYGAHKRGLVFEISMPEFIRLITHSCVYCGRKEFTSRYGTLVYNGVDRVDSKLGYTSDNCVTACFSCNSCKSDKSLIDFQTICFEVTMETLRKRKAPLEVIYELKDICAEMRGEETTYVDGFDDIIGSELSDLPYS